jgi:hypothetical protein
MICGADQIHFGPTGCLKLGAPNFQSRRKSRAGRGAILTRLGQSFEVLSGRSWELPTFTKRPLPSSGNGIDRERRYHPRLFQRRNYTSASPRACSFAALTGAPNASGRHLVSAAVDLGDGK